MIQKTIDIYSGLIFMKNKKILLLKKKDTDIYTIPFIKLENDNYLVLDLQKTIKNILGVEITENTFINPILVNKIDKSKNTSIGYFNTIINWTNEFSLNEEQNIYDKYTRFGIEDLKYVEITPDLKEILYAVFNGKKYLEIIEK